MDKLKSIKMFSVKWILVLYVIVILQSMKVNGLSSIDERDSRKLFGGYRITPKFCRASKTLPKSDPRAHGPTMCMFNHECNQRHGEVVGACMDGFLFGTCCQLPLSVDTPIHLENPIYSSSNVAAALSYESYVHNQQLANNKLGTFNEYDQQSSSNKPYEEVIDIDDGQIYIHDIPIKTSVSYYSSSTPSPSSPSSSSSSSYFQSSTPLIHIQSPTKGEFYLPPPSSTPSTLNHPGYNDDYATILSDNVYSSSLRPPLTPQQQQQQQQQFDEKNDFTSSGMSYIANTLLNEDKTEFSHSDITHPAADSILMESNEVNNSNQYFSNQITSSTHKPSHSTFSKPGFKPKPTTSTITNSNGNFDNNYVLVHTITNNSPGKINSATSNDGQNSVQPQNGMSDNGIESIESIILMLNDTKTGPQYNTISSSTEQQQTDFTKPTSNYQSTINQDKYGSTSFYITTKSPSSTTTGNKPTKSSSTTKPPPSTSYVFSPSPTKRPIQVQSTISSSYGAISSTINSNRIVLPSSTLQPPISTTIHTKKPQIISNTTKRPPPSKPTQPPSTSYVYSISTTKRPSAASSVQHDVVITPSTRRPPTPTNQHKTTNKKTNIVRTTAKYPSTSYVTGPTTPRPKQTINQSTNQPSTGYVYSKPTKRIRPATAATTASSISYTTTKTNALHEQNQNTFSSTTPAPTVIVLGPFHDYVSSTTDNTIINDNYVLQSKPQLLNSQQQKPPPSLIRDDFTDRPTPTVHITPKPTAVNIATTASWKPKPTILRDRFTTIKVPSTSYVYSPVVTQRPTEGTYHTSTINYDNNNNNNNNYEYASAPSHNYHDGETTPNYIGSISNYDGSSSTFTYEQQQQLLLQQSQLVHKNPVSPEFDDPGYYGPVTTVHPLPSKINIQHTVTSQPIYTLNANDPNNNINNNNNYYNYISSSASPMYPGLFGSPATYGHYRPSSSTPITPQSDVYNNDQYPSTINEDFNNDMNNFPPVRNPNLNMSATYIGSGIKIEDYDISTPTFIDDQALNDKMGLLVSKIVESLQENFDNLEDIVFDDSNTTTIVHGDQQTSTGTHTSQQTTTIKKPIATRKPAGTIVTKKPTLKPSAKPSAKPSVAAAAVKPSAKPKPTRVPTRKPITKRPAQTATTAVKPTLNDQTKPVSRPTGTKRPTVTTATPTKRPVSQLNTKKPTRKPTTVQVINTTKKPITKGTSKRPPTKRVTTAKPTTTQSQDETSYEEDQSTELQTSQEENEISEEDGAASEPFNKRIQCGIRPQVKSGRIVGGKGAAFGEFPWQVLVRESTWLGLFTKNKCGGVLIAKNYVMTAAHCQPGFLASLVAVMGEFDMTGDLEKKRSITKNVKRVVVHREYDAATFENDLALLELESEIHYDTHIVPICMPPDVADFTGRMATVTGWGRLKYGGGVPSILQEVQVPVIENGVCEEMFHTAGHNKKILPSFLCAGYANGQKDSCEGDSGGPLVLQRGDGRWELAGTVSHGIKCAAPYLPGVYMRTTYFKPWIQSVTGLQ